jgi:hypothetical protein
MSYSPELKLTTQFAEKISSEVDGAKLAEMLKRLILEKDFSENSIVYLQEYNLTSPPQERILGQLSWINNLLNIRRSFRSSRGTHYGLDVDIEQGDTSSTIVKEGSWTVHTKILREDKLLGEIVKIVTPIDLCDGGKLRYIDLGLNIIKKDGEIKEINTGVITQLFERSIISSQLKDDIYSMLEDCKKQLTEDQEQILIIK